MITQVINSKPSNVLQIEFMLGNLCNHKCSYCFPGSNEGDSPWPDINLLIKNLDHLLNFYKRNGKTTFEFYIIGGEPTIWKDLPALCSHLKEYYDVIIRISTNGSRSISWWDKNSKYFDSIEISVHHEFAKIDHIKEVCDTIYKHKVELSANVLLDPAHLEKCQHIVEELKTSKHRWPIIAKAVKFNGVTRYNENQKKYFDTTLKREPSMSWWLSLTKRTATKVWVVEEGVKKQVQDSWIVLNEQNKFKNWICNLGVDHIEISKDGTIGGTCKEPIYGLPAFNLYQEDFTNVFDPELVPVICGKELCHCGHEISIK